MTEQQKISKEEWEAQQIRDDQGRLTHTPEGKPLKVPYPPGVRFRARRRPSCAWGVRVGLVVPGLVIGRHIVSDRSERGVAARPPPVVTGVYRTAVRTLEAMNVEDKSSEANRDKPHEDDAMTTMLDEEYAKSVRQTTCSRPDGRGGGSLRRARARTRAGRAAGQTPSSTTAEPG